ncbi:MAG TPA: hypothetical protein VHT91_39935 [Kofleriaceae bacterium]|nr:hypothetical protein [Kofleriaceae bacterium]
MNMTIFETISVAHPSTAVGPSPTEMDVLQSIDLAQLEYVNGADLGSFVHNVGYRALNLAKASVNGAVNTYNWGKPESVDVNLGVIKAHFEPKPIPRPFGDDPLQKAVQGPNQRALPPGH